MQETSQRQLLAALMEDVAAREDEIEALRRAELTHCEALHMATCKRDAARRYMAVQEHQLQDLLSAVAAGLPAIQVRLINLLNSGDAGCSIQLGIGHRYMHRAA